MACGFPASGNGARVKGFACDETLRRWTCHVGLVVVLELSLFKVCLSLDLHQRCCPIRKAWMITRFDLVTRWVAAASEGDLMTTKVVPLFPVLLCEGSSVPKGSWKMLPGVRQRPTLQPVRHSAPAFQRRCQNATSQCSAALDFRFFLNTLSLQQM